MRCPASTGFADLQPHPNSLILIAENLFLQMSKNEVTRGIHVLSNVNEHLINVDEPKMSVWILYNQDFHVRCALLTTSSRVEPSLPIIIRPHLWQIKHL